MLPSREELLREVDALPGNPAAFEATWDADRDRACPCRRCGIPLLQRDPCPWRGVCYHCHLEEQREMKEAGWTPEERAGPRCHLCGNPARGTMGRSPACSDCLEKHEQFPCSGCGMTVLILRTQRQGDLCHLCGVRARLDGVPEADRRAIRDAASGRGEFEALVVAKRLLGWSLYDARDAVHLLSARSLE